MSRVGKKPVTIPAGVVVTVDNNNVVTVKGPKLLKLTVVKSLLKTLEKAKMLVLTTVYIVN